MLIANTFRGAELLVMNAKRSVRTFRFGTFGKSRIPFQDARSGKSFRSITSTKPVSERLAHREGVFRTPER